MNGLNYNCCWTKCSGGLKDPIRDPTKAIAPWAKLSTTSSHKVEILWEITSYDTIKMTS